MSRLVALLMGILMAGSAAAEEPSALPEVAGEIRSLEAFCAANGSSAVVETGFARLVDVDAAGRDDLVFDDAHGRCARGIQPHCGTGGCTLRVWLADAKGYRPIFRQVGIRHTLAPALGGGQILTIVQRRPYPPAVFRFADGCAVPVGEAGSRQCGN